MPIDILWGRDTLRIGIDSNSAPEEIMQPTGADIVKFNELVEPYVQLTRRPLRG